MNSVKRLRRWVIWFGGWELANGEGWRFEYGPTPVSLFGHFITFYGGGWVDVRVGRGTLVVFFPGSHRRSVPGCHAYWSPNGTPGHERARLVLGNRANWETR
jgi:hypothetical protein